MISGVSSLIWMCSSLPSQEPPQSSRVLLKGRIYPLWYSVLETPITLVSPEFRLHFLNKGDTNHCPVARKSPQEERWGNFIVHIIWILSLRNQTRDFSVSVPYILLCPVYLFISLVSDRSVNLLPFVLSTLARSNMQLPHCFNYCSFCYVVDISGSDATAAAKSLQSCPTRCNPIDSSPPGSPVPGILQARTLEWVAAEVQPRLIQGIRRRDG